MRDRRYYGALRDAGMKKFIFANIIIVACITLSAEVTAAVVY